MLAGQVQTNILVAESSRGRLHLVGKMQILRMLRDFDNGRNLFIASVNYVGE